MISNEDLQKALDLIKKSSQVLITTHTKVDGDATGCCVAVREALAALGKQSKILFLSSLPQWYGFLFDEKVPVLGVDISPEELSAGQFGRFDLTVIVDTNSFSQLPKLDAYLKQNNMPVLVIDHHATADGLGDVELLDSQAAAASSIVLQLYKYAGWRITAKVSQALFTGIATDTGWFHFNNTDSVVFRDCAELTDAGANPSEIYHDVCQSFSPERFRLMTAMQNSLELHFDNRCATQFITQQDFKTTGAKYEDTENLIDQSQRIATVEVAVLFVELADGRWRCSLRSRGAVDVCRIAQRFDGGGHTCAAGAFLPAPLKQAKNTILEMVGKSLSDHKA